MNKFFTIIIFLFFYSSCFSQSGDFQLGARNAAMGGTSVTNKDAWSLFNNVGGLGGITESSGFVSYQNRFDIRAFQVVGTGYNQQFNFGNAGLAFYRFGDDLFNQQKLSLGIGNTIDRVSLGLSFNLVQYHVETIGTTIAFVLEFGGIVQLADALSLGAHIYNLNQVRLSDQEPIPTLIKTGLSYHLGTTVIISVEVQKELDFSEVLKFGIEYEALKNVWVRTGVSSNPLRLAFGAGFGWQSVRFDYSFNDQSNLGAIHEFSLTYLVPGQP